MIAKKSRRSILGLPLLLVNTDGVGGSGQYTITLQSTLFLVEIGVIGSLQEEDKTTSGRPYSISLKRSM